VRGCGGVIGPLGIRQRFVFLAGRTGPSWPIGWGDPVKHATAAGPGFCLHMECFGRG